MTDINQDNMFDSTAIHPDYRHWFNKEAWTLEQAAWLTIGLEPSVFWQFDHTNISSIESSDSNLGMRVHDYTEELADELYYIYITSLDFFQGEWCGGKLSNQAINFYDELLQSNSVGVNPWVCIQLCFDENRPIHYLLREYLEEHTDFQFRFSKNSRILSEFELFSRKERWWLPQAVLMVLGLSPETNDFMLRKRKNLNRNMEGNYTLTQRDQWYYVMELALESYENKGLTPNNTV